jgi:hypothetical protein
MRLLEFSNTIIIPNSNNAYENMNVEYLTPLVTMIKENCSDCLEAMQISQRTAWRGVKHHPELAFSAFPPPNRDVKDSDPEMTIMVDKVLEEYGVEARRQNSIFVTSDQSNTKEYGSTFAIFPYNSAEFSWSQNKKFHDMVINPRATPYWLINQVDKSEAFKNILAKVQQNEGNYWNLNHQQKILNLLQRITEENYEDAEISLRSLAIQDSNLSDELGYDDDTFVKLFSINKAAMMSDLRIKTTDFASALINEGEILINGEYIAVRESAYLHIQKLFLGIFR